MITQTSLDQTTENHDNNVNQHCPVDNKTYADSSSRLQDSAKLVKKNREGGRKPSTSRNGNEPDLNQIPFDSDQVKLTRLQTQERLSKCYTVESNVCSIL